MNKKQKYININNIINILTIVLCCIVIYIIPVSSNFNLTSTIHGNIYRFTRLFIVPICILGLLLNFHRTKQQWTSYIALSIITIISFILKREIPFTNILLLSFFIAFDCVYNNIDQIKTLFKNNNTRKILMIFLVFIVQILVMFIINNNRLSVMSSFKDANYTGYFLIILYFIIGDESNYKFFQKRDIILLLALLTFSRTALISILIIYFFRITKIFRDKSVNKPLIIFYTFFGLFMIVCYLYTSIFEKSDYVYEYKTGFNRFTTILDYSNYMRTSANIKVLGDVNFKNLLIGYTEESYSKVVHFEKKTIHPHNLFLAIYTESGILFAICMVLRMFRMFKGKKNMIPMYLVLIVYSMILGPSMYYGVDLFFIILVIVSQKNSEVEVNKIE